jgi:hypothetical protein
MNGPKSGAKGEFVCREKVGANFSPAARTIPLQEVQYERCSFDIDIEHCPNCGGTLKILAAIEEPPVIVRMLAHLGLPTRAPARAPAQRLDLFQAGLIRQPRAVAQPTKVGARPARRATAPSAATSAHGRPEASEANGNFHPTTLAIRWRLTMRPPTDRLIASEKGRLKFLLTTHPPTRRSPPSVRPRAPASYLEWICNFTSS